MARGQGNVVVRIYGEIRDLVGKLREGSSEVGRFATSSRNVIQRSFSDITSIITSRFGAAGNEAQKALDRIGAQATASGNAVALGVGAGAAAAGAGLVALGVQGIRSFVDLANKIRELQRVTGAAAEDASALVAVMDDLKIPAEQGAAAFFRLSKNIAGNAEALKAHGIAIAHNKNGSVDLQATLLNVADAYNRVGRGAEGNKVAFDAFGRSGAALIPLLEEGRQRLAGFFAEADKHGEILSQKEIDQARKYELALDDLHDAVGGLERSLGEGLVPALTETAGALSEVIDLANQLAKPVGGIKGFIKGIVENAPGLREIHLLQERYGKKNKDVADSAKEAAAAVSNFTDNLDGQPSAADAATSALSAYKQAIENVDDSILGIPSAMGDVNDAFAALEDTADSSTSKAADAQRRLADSIESSNRRIRDAEQELADAKEDLNKQASGDRTDARRRVRDAEQRLTDARSDGAKAVAEAKKNVDDLNPSLDEAGRKTQNIRREMESVVSAVEKTVEEMIRNKRPTSEILAYITRQRDRLGEVGSKIGANRVELQLYLDVLTKVWQTTKDLAGLVGSLGFAGGGGGDFGGKGASGSWDAPTNGGSASPTIIQNFYGPTDPAENQRLAVKGLNSALRRRG